MDKGTMDKGTMEKGTMEKGTMDKVIMEEVSMEECIICFDETDKFIIFICNHKACERCYPLIMEQRPNCPLCNKSLLNDIPMLPFTVDTPFTRDSQITRVVQIDSGPISNLLIFVCIVVSLIFFMSVIGGSIYIREK